MARSLSERLAALQNSVATKKTEPAAYSQQKEAMPSAEGTHPLERLGFQCFTGEEGTYYVRELRYDLLTRHGTLRFQDALSTDIGALFKAVKVEPVNVREMCFYDTETTGLGTGAGTFPFLHAVAEFGEDELILYQYFLEDYSQEQTMLSVLRARHFEKAKAVVSFNGKSFDWPMLQSRFAMYRHLQFGLPHIDLLFPARRLWRQTLERVTLSSIEENILGLVRTDDVPGREAPSRYFEYVMDKVHHRIQPVLDHNAADVCALVVLMAWLAQTLQGEHPLERAAEYAALGRYHDEWQSFDIAEQCLKQAVESPDVTWKERWLFAMYQKRRKNWPAAVKEWMTMTELYPWTLGPAVELAKYFEHKERDYEKALVWVNAALERAAIDRRLSQFQNKEVAARFSEVTHSLLHRRARIERKAAGAER